MKNTRLSLQKPLLQALGQMTGHEPSTWVSCGEVIPRVLQLAGFDSKDRPVIARIRATFVYGYKRPPDRRLTICGPKSGLWGLTSLGVAEARKFNSPVERDKNLTAAYLEKRIKTTGGLKGRFMSLLHMAVATSLPISAATGRVEDHVQTYLSRLIARDALRDRILAGENISDQLLATFAVRSGYTDIRDESTNPVVREMYGARTHKERAEGQVARNPLTDPRLVWKKDENTGQAQCVDIEDIESSATAEAAVERLMFEQSWEQVLSKIQSKGSRLAGRYATILDMKVRGADREEIAETLGISPCRVAGMLAKAQAIACGVFQKHVN